ncbi:cytochrome P450 [Dacryopinax primogenitus]|uniref:Cytochrome P450 n=1 Tax=Dacryopinax primogenitus (strain DJM 731) TaxID=1858805 RepID=M5FWX7_DACPD|nr:cytochrome P450 [Dacryopinax primogenitus]EJT97961.1 cytochrome P450 [Dacryopinax primogenitus]
MSNLLLPLIPAVALLLLVGWRRVKQKNIPLPPGPKSHVFIGNLFEMPKEDDPMVYSRWQKTYGDMIYVNVLGKDFLIINSLKIAADLLEKRSSIYSGRNYFTFGGELCGHDRSTALAEGSAHREMRKFGHRSMNSTSIKQWQWLQEAEARKTLKQLLHKPENWNELFHLNAGSSIMRIVYGYELAPENDPLLRHANMVMEDFSQACAPGRWIVDVLPFLKHVPEWMPGAGFQKIAKKWWLDVDRMYRAPFELVKQRMAAGIALPSITAQLLEVKKEQSDEEHMISAMGALYAGGVDTTPAALGSFMMVMILYPDVQKKAQAELDAIVGPDRLPGFIDQANLPYVNALIKEILRWAPSVPMGLPHRLIQDDEYNGYRIPKDTILLTNIWHMNRDSATYPDAPDCFRPDRFLGPDPAPHGFSTSNTQEFGSPAFGFGRRVCPGEHFAFPSLFILCASILATMDISPAMDAAGNPILPQVQFSSGVIAHPKPFRCNITPRSHKAVDLINVSG